MNPVSRLTLLVALVLAAINLRPGITSLAPLIERIADELALSRGLISLTTALPVLCMGLLAPVAPRLAQRFGLERTIAACLALIGVALLLRLAGQVAVLLIGSAVLLGAGIAVAGPLMSGFIKRHFTTGIGGAIGWYSLSMALGGAAGAVLTLPVVLAFDGSWPLGLAAWALPAVVALVFWLRLPNRPEPAGAAGGLPWREPRAWLITVFFALQAGLFYSLATWLVARYQEAGLGELRSNALFSLFMLIGLPFSFLVPWLAQRISRHVLLCVSAMLASISLIMITVAPGLWPEVWAITLGTGLTGSFALALILPMYEVQSPLDVSRWTAMMLCAGYCMACVTPSLTGLVRDYGGTWQWPFALLSLFALSMIFLALLMRPRR